MYLNKYILYNVYLSMDLIKFVKYIVNNEKYKPVYVIKNYNEVNSNDNKYWEISGILVEGIKYRIGWSFENKFEIPNYNINYSKSKIKLNNELILLHKKKNRIKKIHNLLILLNNWSFSNDISFIIIKFLVK